MSDAPRPRKGLVLIGYRGTGKSTVGRILADRLPVAEHLTSGREREHPPRVLREPQLERARLRLRLQATQAQAEPDHRLACGFALVGESVRAKLPAKEKKQIAQDLKTAHQAGQCQGGTQPKGGIGFSQPSLMR